MRRDEEGEETRKKKRRGRRRDEEGEEVRKEKR